MANSADNSASLTADKAASNSSEPVSVTAPETSTAPFLITGAGKTTDIHPAEAEAITRLTDELTKYLSAKQVAEVRRAYRFGANAHLGQTRKSGEPYITHPLAVAKVLAEMRLEPHTIIAGILHDTIEDTPVTFNGLVEAFDEDVAVLVEAVTKLDKIHFSSREEQQAENFRKMLLAMSRDIRVILIKLADRLHNMRTLGAMVPAARRRIGRETLDIYAPIAGRLGMNTVRKELENRGFSAVHPWREAALSSRLKKRWGHRKDALRTVQNRLERGFHEHSVTGTITGRQKHLYSLYKKMQDKKLDFTEVMDVFALRVVVNSVDDCYRAIGVAHNAFSPVPGKFKDYIAIPKANGYQSLHTVLSGPDGVPIELQVRTVDQHRVAENGIAAHWLYKEGDEVPEARSLDWLRSLLEIQQQSGNSTDFLENVKVDLFPDEVYVFTPKGDIMRLPHNATVIDFAFAVHSKVGQKTIAAKVDRRMTPLSSKLVNGQIVEIITSKTGRPNPAWLDFATTAKARSVIRHYLQGLHEEDAERMGRRLLDSALSKLNSGLADTSTSAINRVLNNYELESAAQLFTEIGMGNRSPMLVAHQLAQPEDLATDLLGQKPAPMVITGGEGLAITLAKCCHPIPGDPILGYLSAGRGLVVHRRGCNNLADYRKNPENWLELTWSADPAEENSAQVRISTINRRGVLAAIASLIASEGCNIEHVESSERDGSAASLVVTFTVANRVHLARVMRKLRNSEPVLKVARARG